MRDIYKYIIFILILIIMSILFPKLSKKINEQDRKKTQKNIIKQPLIYKIGGIISCAFGILIIISGLIFGEKIIETMLVVIIVFIPLLFSSIAILLFEKNWQIEIKEDAFTFRNIFKKERTYKYTEVMIKPIKSGYRVYKDGKHLFAVAYYQLNCNVLADVIYKNQKMGKK